MVVQQVLFSLPPSPHTTRVHRYKCTIPYRVSVEVHYHIKYSVFEMLNLKCLYLFSLWVLGEHFCIPNS